MQDSTPRIEESSTGIRAAIAVKAVIEDGNGNILVLLRSRGTGADNLWSLPGGGLESGEDPETGVRREILEETRLQVGDCSVFHIKSYLAHGEPRLVIGFRCRALPGTLTLNWEHTDSRWTTRATALGMDLSPDARTLLERYPV